MPIDPSVWVCEDPDVIELVMVARMSAYLMEHSGLAGNAAILRESAAQVTIGEDA